MVVVDDIEVLVVDDERVLVDPTELVVLEVIELPGLLEGVTETVTVVTPEETVVETIT